MVLLAAPAIVLTGCSHEEAQTNQAPATEPSPHTLEVTATSAVVGAIDVPPGCHHVTDQKHVVKIADSRGEILAADNLTGGEAQRRYVDGDSAMYDCLSTATFEGLVQSPFYTVTINDKVVDVVPTGDSTSVDFGPLG